MIGPIILTASAWVACHPVPIVNEFMQTDTLQGVRYTLAVNPCSPRWVFHQAFWGDFRERMEGSAQ